MNRIYIKFVDTPKLHLPIRNVMKNAFTIQPDISAPSIFQVAAHLDEFITTHPEFVVPLSRKMPFADLMLHPEKVEAVLQTAEDGTKSAGKPPAARKFGREAKASGHVVEKKTNNAKGNL